MFSLRMSEMNICKSKALSKQKNKATRPGGTSSIRGSSLASSFVISLLLINTKSKPTNHMAATQYICALRHTEAGRHLFLVSLEIARVEEQR